MKLKALLLVLVAATGVSVSAFAQQEASAGQPEFRPHLYGQVQGGAAFTRGETVFYKLLSPAGYLSVGYQFNPVLGLRVVGGGWQGKGNGLMPLEVYKFNFLQGNADLTLSLSSLFGYNPYRVLDLYGFVGGGALFAFNNGAKPVSETNVTPFEYLWDTNIGPSLGLMLTAWLFSGVLGFVLGVIAGVYRDSPADKNSFPALSTNWSNNTYWGAAWNKSEVTSTTRAVAVSKTLNYGTALLRSSFAYDDSVIEDNNGGVHTGEENNKIDVSTGSKFRVTGILIGGVSEEVGWDFLPKDGKFNKMIYDRLGENSFYIPVYSDNPDAKYSNPVYTCVWDNYNSTLGADEQSPVYIGLELVNNTGQDIWGELNLIRNGGTFYLVGELNPKTAAVPANMKDANGKINLSRADMFYPPFDENGKTINAPRVFMQDYVTDVKFKFTEDALKHAYVTMPDLRAGQVSLGLSVDLAWTPGLTFEVEMGNVSGN